MHLSGLVLACVLFVVAPAAAQSQAASQHPYGLDPYNPTDAAILRNYGSVLVAQTPLLELRKLDPFKPSEAALLRQLGGAIPVCCVGWYAPIATPLLTPFPPPLPPAPPPALERRVPQPRE